jgi:hypothetical protein
MKFKVQYTVEVPPPAITIRLDTLKRIWEYENPGYKDLEVTIQDVPADAVSCHAAQCCECGREDAIQYNLEKEFYLNTGELLDILDDGTEIPYFETVTGSGFAIICPDCGMVDGEPPEANI